MPESMDAWVNGCLGRWLEGRKTEGGRQMDGWIILMYPSGANCPLETQDLFRITDNQQ